MEFLQYLDTPYSVVGLIVFVAAGALGVRAKSAAKAGGKSYAPLFFGLAVVGLATTVGIAWLDMRKTQGNTEPAGAAITAQGGSNVATDIQSSGSGSVTINQGNSAP